MKVDINPTIPYKDMKTIKHITTYLKKCYTLFVQKIITFVQNISTDYDK